jgi:hypothetical protein
MKLSNETFEKIKWFFNAFLAFKKSTYPLTKIGAKLIVGTPILSFLATITFPKDFIISSLEFSTGEASLLLSLISIAIGIALIHFELSSNARQTARVLITGLPGTNAHFPEEVLSKTEARKAREAVQLGAEEGKDSLDIQITRFNSEVCVDLFNRFIVHDNCKKVYIGGLARVPFLVAYGSLLRTLTAEVVYFDKFQRDGKWKKLQEENKKITLNYDELISIPNINGDIGIAIGFTTPINRNQLPEVLKNNTTIISPSIKPDRNLIQNQENLESISSEIQNIIDKLSASDNVKIIHLFLSVQSSLAIQIGRRYQEGTHRKWVVHNFNPDSGNYNWAIVIDKNGTREYTN